MRTIRSLLPTYGLFALALYVAADAAASWFAYYVAVNQ